jgi:hypothetical protein
MVEKIKVDGKLTERVIPNKDHFAVQLHMRACVFRNRKKFYRPSEKNAFAKEKDGC